MRRSISQRSLVVAGGHRPDPESVARREESRAEGGTDNDSHHREISHSELDKNFQLHSCFDI